MVPRINQIEDAWQQITRCVPEAKIAIGHSKVYLVPISITIELLILIVVVQVLRKYMFSLSANNVRFRFFSVVFFFSTYSEVEYLLQYSRSVHKYQYCLYFFE